MRKIVIIGPAGAGKSTLARELGAILNIPIFHLDCYFWRPGWKEMPKGARVRRLEKLVRKDKWIIEGAYFNSSDVRLQSCDTVIFLDMPLHLCVWRVLKRRFNKSQQRRPDLPVGCKERLSLRYMAKLLLFPFIGRRTLVDKLGKVNRGKCTVLHSPTEVEAFLAAQRAYASVATNPQAKSALRIAPVRA